MHLEISGDKMTIHIFGDSFGVDEMGWPHQLSKLKKEKVRCLAEAGTKKTKLFIFEKKRFRLWYLSTWRR